MKDAPWTAGLPETWRKVRLKNLVSSVTPGAWGEEPADGDRVICVRAADFDREHLRVSVAQAPLRKIPSEQFRASRLVPGDLVLEKSGGGEQQPVGAVVMFDHDIPAVPTNFAARVRPADDVDARYLNYVFAATYFLQLNVRSIKQTTGLQNLDTSSFFAEPWAVPPFDDQGRIASFLDRETARIDDLMRRKRDLHGMLKSRRRALVDDILGRNVRRIVRVKNTVRSITSGPRGWSEHFSDTGPVFLRIANVSADSIDLLVRDIVKVTPPEGLEAERTRAEEGDVVVSITAEIGAVGVVTDDLAGCHISQHLALLRTDRGVVEPEWLALCLFGSDAQAQLDSARYGGTKTQLSLEDVAQIQLPLPSADRQAALLAEWRASDATTNAAMRKLDNQIGLLREHRQALTTAAVTGQVEVSGGTS